MTLKSIQWAVYGLLAMGLGFASFGNYRVGGYLLSGSVAVVFLWRLLGPKGRLEYFSVRSRWIDLLTIGALLAVLLFFSFVAR